MICTYCKAENAEDCLYCPNCGKPVAISLEVVEASIALPISESEKPSLYGIPPEGDSGAIRSLSKPLTNTSERITPLPADMPGPQNAHLAQANLSRLRKNWADATEMCIAVLREDPADPAAHSLLGDIYRDQNRLDEAVRWYRMALELSPNPFDQANLQKLERRIAGRSLAIGSTKPGSDPRAGFDPVSGSLAGGTSALMGIPPQKWLKGITVAALGFVCLFVIYLIFLPTKTIAPVPRAVSSDSLASGAQIGSDGLPPARLGGATTLPAGEQSAPTPSTGRVAGTGLPPDLGSATVPTMETPTSPDSSTPAGVGPAPIKSVSPLAPGAAIGSGQVGVMAPSHVGEHNNSLTGGIQLARVQAGSGAATIQLIASDSSAPRDVLVRNIYRAARTVFSNDSTLHRATAIVHAESVDGTSLFSADIDRGTALSADPSSDDLAALVGRLRIH